MKPTSMLDKKREHPAEKIKLHSRNRHRERYDLKLLCQHCPALKPFVALNAYGDESIDFFNPDAVKMLNKALLMCYYDIQYWDIPNGYLCPPIPGRADYIHHIADVLSNTNNGKILTGGAVKILDIGVGANCIYPIIGCKEYGWKFIGSDMDAVAVTAANTIIQANSVLKNNIEIRLQKNQSTIFNNIILKDEKFDFTICNPPFHASLAEAEAGSIRKLNNLKKQKTSQPILNFGGKKNELWCDGGEAQFLINMIQESKLFANSCLWFSSLVAKESNLKTIYTALKKAEAVEVKTIPMGTGNKTSRVVAWTFLTKPQQQKWADKW